jgi:chemotaxis protein methyltransferase CheR
MGLREFKAFREMIHEHTGIWLRDGKQVMLASRLARRLRHLGISSYAEYYTYLQTHPGSDELREMINCVTTNKTSFFRERHHFDFLANTVVPEVQAAVLRGGPRSIRVWSAASSTGEEPYTIAITLLEALQSGKASASGLNLTSNSWRIEVVASDIDTKVLDTAVRATYGKDSLAGIAPPLKKKYFLRGKDDMLGQVRVKPDVARLVRFFHLNLMDTNWPIEGLFDVIFFRNALIYFNQDTQEKFLRKMVRFLKPRGYLFLGNAEHVPWIHDILEPLNKTMYRLRSAER